MRLLDYIGRVCLILKETIKPSSRVAVQFCIPSNVNESSYCSISISAFGVVSDFVYFNRCVMVTHCLYFQFCNDIWCATSFFYTHLAFVSLLWQGIYSDLSFILVNWVFFLFLSFKSSLYILVTSPSSGIQFTNIFSLYVSRLPFSFLFDAIICSAKFYI